LPRDWLWRNSLCTARPAFTVLSRRTDKSSPPRGRTILLPRGRARRDKAMQEHFAQLLAWFDDVFIDQFSLWILLGFVAQGMFTMRFLVQWIASEKAKRSVVPVAFWFFSLGGGALLLLYAIHREDPVFIAGQALGLVIYVRNLWLIANEKRSAQ
jgi:lipid-A-disaccharide synthase-like uncharacterized protein